MLLPLDRASGLSFIVRRIVDLESPASAEPCALGRGSIRPTPDPGTSLDRRLPSQQRCATTRFLSQYIKHDNMTYFTLKHTKEVDVTESSVRFPLSIS